MHAFRCSFKYLFWKLLFLSIEFPLFEVNTSNKIWQIIICYSLFCFDWEIKKFVGKYSFNLKLLSIQYWIKWTSILNSFKTFFFVLNEKEFEKRIRRDKNRFDKSRLGHGLHFCSCFLFVSTDLCSDSGISIFHPKHPYETDESR